MSKKCLYIITTSCESTLTMHVYYIQRTAYNCNARLHTYATRTGQRTPLPCARKRQTYIG